MFDGQVELIRKLNADLIIASRLKYNMVVEEPFARRRLYQALDVDGVKGAYALYVGESLWKDLEGRTISPIRVLGYDPADPVFTDPDIRRLSVHLYRPDTALFDVRSRDFFGTCRTGTTSELGNRLIRLAGTFSLGPDLINDGNLIMSDKNFLKFFSEAAAPGTTLSLVDLGIVTIERPDADVRSVQRALRVSLPEDVVVLTKQEFIEQEMDYWQRNSPIGYIFSFGAAMGFLVGVIICYQILFSDVSNQMPQFGTLKAIGYHNSYLVGVVLREALSLSVLGFVPGLLLSYLLYMAIESLTGLPLRMAPPRIALIFLLTIFMCFISGTLALRKVLSADPAEVF